MATRNRATSGAVCPVCGRNIGIRPAHMVVGPGGKRGESDRISRHDYPKDHEKSGQCLGSGRDVTVRWSHKDGQQPS